MKTERGVANAQVDLDFIGAVVDNATKEESRFYSECFSMFAKGRVPEAKQYETGKEMTAILLIFWFAFMAVDRDEEEELIPFINVMVKDKDMEGSVHLVAMHLFGMAESVSVETSISPSFDLCLLLTPPPPPDVLFYPSMM
jgi:hypothetical protein